MIETCVTRNCERNLDRTEIVFLDFSAEARNVRPKGFRAGVA